VDIVAVPVKPFGLAKARLAAAFSGAERAAIGRETATNTVRTILEAIGAVSVVTADADVARWANDSGARVIDEDIDLRPGLSGAAAQVAAAAAGGRWMIVHADLPLLSRADIETAWNAVRTDRIVLAPSHDGGTSVVGGSGDPIDFSYGPGSFHRHLAAARRRPVQILIRRGFLLDLDDPTDFRAAARNPRGSWLLSAATQ